MFCAEANVVRAEKLWPRSLLTPFTDNVDLTREDRRAYTSYAAAQQNKGFQEITTQFHPHDTDGDGEIDPGSGDPDTNGSDTGSNTNGSNTNGSNTNGSNTDDGDAKPGSAEPDG